MTDTKKSLQDIVDEEFRHITLSLKVNVYYDYNGCYLVTVTVPSTELLRQPHHGVRAYMAYAFRIKETELRVPYDAYHHSGHYFYKDTAGDVMRLTRNQLTRFDRLVKEAVEADVKRRAKLVADAKELETYLKTQRLTDLSISPACRVDDVWVLSDAEGVWVLRFTLDGDKMAYGFVTTDGLDVDYIGTIESYVGKPLAHRNKQLLRDIWNFHFDWHTSNTPF